MTGPRTDRADETRREEQHQTDEPSHGASDSSNKRSERSSPGSVTVKFVEVAMNPDQEDINALEELTKLVAPFGVLDDVVHNQVVSRRSHRRDTSVESIEEPRAHRSRPTEGRRFVASVGYRTSTNELVAAEVDEWRRRLIAWSNTGRQGPAPTPGPTPETWLIQAARVGSA